MSSRAGRSLRDASNVLRFVYTHPANRGSRLRAVARAGLFQVRGRLGRSTIAPLGRQARIWADLHYTASSKALYGNPPDWQEMQAWRHLLRPGHRFIDVGSNVGSYALWAADCGAEVIAIEPSPDALAKLRRNLDLNLGLPISVLECGLAATSGHMVITQGLGTVNHVVVDEYDGDVLSVEMRTLDEVLDGGVAMGVKIDVEGAERVVLEGGRESLETGRIGVLQLEWNTMSQHVMGEDRDRTAALLSEYGYCFFRPDENGVLQPTTDLTFGADIFAALPATLQGDDPRF